MRLAALTLAWLTACGSARDLRLDGEVRTVEWQHATRHRLHPVGELSLRRDGETLQIALDGPVVGIGSVLLHDGARVYVLHASASLGTAIFERQPDGTWRATQHFRWEASDPEDEVRRRAFRETHGWLANPIPRGPNVDWRRDREFSIDLARFRASGPLRIAAGLLHVTGNGAVVERWPSTVDDDAASLPLHRGDTSRGYLFRPETWFLLEE